MKGKQALPNDDPSESRDYGWLRSFVTCTPAVLFGIPAPSPCAWNDDRRHLHARLDALYFHLYGLSRDAAGYVFDTFPIAHREDERQFGRYRTRDMVLAYMNALAAGDAETRVAV